MLTNPGAASPLSRRLPGIGAVVVMLMMPGGAAVSPANPDLGAVAAETAAPPIRPVANAYVSIEVTGSTITSLRVDPHGGGRYGLNLLRSIYPGDIPPPESAQR
jgi:hypothetical protein